VEDIATILKDKTEGYLDALIKSTAAVSRPSRGRQAHGKPADHLNPGCRSSTCTSFDRATGAGTAQRVDRRARTVINITSIAGSRVHPFAGSAYAASKAALVALTPGTGA